MGATTVVLVHGAFADSSSWNEVIARLDEDAVAVIAVANPLRSVIGDADYVREVLDGVSGQVLLVGHAYGGMVITQAGLHDRVAGLVYVSAFAPDHGENAFELLAKFPGSALAEHTSRYPITGGAEIVVRREAFVEHFAADVPRPLAAAMSVTQRPITEQALDDRLNGSAPAWQSRPSWFVYGDEDRAIPFAALTFMAERAHPVLRRVLWGGSQAVPVSQPDAVADVILAAVSAIQG